jgi:hypothetical protein
MSFMRLKANPLFCSVTRFRIHDFEVETMTPKYVAPSISANSFSCPHCGTLAHQTWFKLYAGEQNETELPHVNASPAQFAEIQCDREIDENTRAECMGVLARLGAG